MAVRYSLTFALHLYLATVRRVSRPRRSRVYVPEPERTYLTRPSCWPLHFAPPPTLCSVLLAGSLLNMFVRNDFLLSVQLYAGLAIFCG